MSRLDTKLDQLFTYAPVLSYKKDSKFILMSDCHRGQGNWGDNFLPNQNVFYGDVYKRQGLLNPVREATWVMSFSQSHKSSFALAMRSMVIY